jgi:hypothetical protein
MSYPSVHVWWHDAAVTPGWHTAENLDKIGPNLTLACGLLVHKDAKVVRLAMLVDKEGDAGHVLAIPASQVVKIEVIKRPGRGVR